MKAFATLVAWTFVAGVALFAAVNPEGGVVYQNPVATAGIGLIGLGLFMVLRCVAKSALDFSISIATLTVGRRYGKTV